MVRLPPSGSDATDDVDLDFEPRVIDLESEAADEVLDALSSRTAREVFATLQEDPATPSAVASAVDTSVQNAQYHLEKLRRADAVRVVDTEYSQKGREMKLYAPANRPLVVFAGDQGTRDRLESAVRRPADGADTGSS